MKKTAVFVAILSLSLSIASVSAQDFVGGANPRPQFVGGANPRPQFVGGANPRPQALTPTPAPVSGFGMWFSTVMHFFGM